MTAMPNAQCPALDAVREWRAADAAVEAFGRDPSSYRPDEDVEGRHRVAFDRLHELALAERVPVSKAGALAALELAADAECEALDVDDCRALVRLALRHLQG